MLFAVSVYCGAGPSPLWGKSCHKRLGLRLTVVPFPSSRGKRACVGRLVGKELSYK
ncbi:hypothetical protein M9458_050288, partial [Cirrhinus mrigala]